MKFKVGQKVRVKEDLTIGKHYGGYSFSVGMEKYEGKTYMISDVNIDHYWLDGCVINSFHYKFTDEMLEPAEFTKADLETGMVVEYRDGRRRVVFGDRLLGGFSHDLLQYYDDIRLVRTRGNREIDIMKLYKPILEGLFCFAYLLIDENPRLK